MLSAECKVGTGTSGAVPEAQIAQLQQGSRTDSAPHAPTLHNQPQFELILPVIG